MAQNRALCDRKAQSCSSDFPRSRLVDTIEALVDLSLCLFRNSDSCVLDSHLKILVVGIYGENHSAVVTVVLDRVLHQIVHDLVDSGRIDLGKDFLLIDQGQLYIAKPCYGLESLHGGLSQLIDVRSDNDKFDVRPVLFYHCQKIRDDLVLPVDLMIDIFQEIPVDCRIHFILGQKRGCEHLHGSHRGLELMRHIGDEFLPGLVQSIHTAQNIVESIRYMNRLQILRSTDRLIRISFLDLTDISGQHFEGPHQGPGNQNGSNKNHYKHHGQQEHGLPSEDFLCLRYVFRGSAGDHDPSDRIGLGLISRGQVAHAHG